MSRFVQIVDFTGEKTIAQSIATDPKLQAYIDKYEPIYLTNLLGCELYDLFIADLDAQDLPQSQRFIDIFDPFCKDDSCGIVRSEGIKEMLLCFIYFEYAKDNNFQQSTNGTVSSQMEVSKVIPLSHTNGYDMFNNGIDTYCSIQWLMLKSTEYPEFNGQYKKKISWL